MARGMNIPSPILARPRAAIALAPLVVLALALLLTFLLYVPSLDDWFIFHDFVHINGAAHTDTGTFLEKIFDPSDGGESIFNTGKLYRPLYYLTFLANYKLFGLEPFGYHLENVLLHVLITFLVWLFARKLTRSEVAATVAALVYGIHPVYMDVPAWVTNINEIEQAFLYIAGTYLFIRSLEATGRAQALSYVGSLLAAALALANRETGVGLFAVIPAYYFLAYRPQDWRQPRAWVRFVPYAVIIGAYAVTRLTVLGSVASGEGSTGVGKLGWHMFINVFKFSGWTWVPIFNVDSLWIKVAQGVAAIATIRMTEHFLVKGGGAGRFAAAWWYLAMIPYTTQETYLLGGRYLYTPMIGFAIMAGLLAASLPQIVVGWRPALANWAWAAAGGGVLVVAGVFSWGTVHRELNYASNGRESHALISQLHEEHPTIAPGTIVYVVDPPRSMLFADVPLYLAPAVHLFYPQVADVKNLSRAKYNELAAGLANDVVLFYQPP